MRSSSILCVCVKTTKLCQWLCLILFEPNVQECINDDMVGDEAGSSLCVQSSVEVVTMQELYDASSLLRVDYKIVINL